MQQQMQQIAMATAQAELQKTQAQAELAMAQAQKAQAEAQVIPTEAQAKLLAAASKNTADPMADEFEKRMKIAEQLIKVEDIKSNERIAEMQMENKKAQKQMDEAFKNQFINTAPQ
jgi:hypothetical protein